jgi:hypothetical protein
MAFPPQYREPPPSLPRLLSSGPGRYNIHHPDMRFSGSPAISIPGLDTKDDVPPPLPPPRHLPGLDSPVVHPEELRTGSRGYSQSGSSMQSGYGSMYVGQSTEERPNYKRRDTGSSTNGDEGYASYTSAERFVAATSRRTLP